MSILLLFLLLWHYQLIALNGTVQQVTFTGSVTNKPITFSIYLPPNYATTVSKYYPVVYHLHGIGGTHDGQQISTIPQVFEQAVAQKYWSESIIVFPDGYNNTMWANSYDGTKPAETNVISEIIPYVDATYRTIADKKHRFIEGFSMGGFGALMYFAKYPELFSKVSCYDGAFLNWSNIKSAQPAVVTEIFNNNESNFDQYSPWTYLKKKVSSFKSDTLIKISLGALSGYDKNLRDTLALYGVSYEYAATGCAHQLGCLATAQGINTAIFFNEYLGLTTGVNLTGKGSVNVNVFPNPAQSQITVSLEHDFACESKIEIRNLFGQVVLCRQTADSKTTIDLSGFASGAYFLSVICSGSERSLPVKLMINHL
jgi:S-formylglutathione hydrolase FrmB